LRGENPTDAEKTGRVILADKALTFESLSKTLKLQPGEAKFVERASR